MKRLIQAPNLAIATLWADLLNNAGCGVTVQRAFASGSAGEIPPDQALPELWLDTLLHPPERRWVCTGCSEIVDGPFDPCWACGTAAPPLP